MYRSDIASCFQKSIDGVIKLVRGQLDAASETVKKVLKEDRRYPTVGPSHCYPLCPDLVY